MKCFDHTLLKVSIVVCLLCTGKINAQRTNVLPDLSETTKGYSAFDKEAATGIGNALNLFFAQRELLAESKIQKRIRKKKDPILIPYALNKKHLGLC